VGVRVWVGECVGQECTDYFQRYPRIYLSFSKVSKIYWSFSKVSKNVQVFSKISKNLEGLFSNA